MTIGNMTKKLSETGSVYPSGTHGLRFFCWYVCCPQLLFVFFRNTWICFFFCRSFMLFHLLFDCYVLSCVCNVVFYTGHPFIPKSPLTKVLRYANWYVILIQLFLILYLTKGVCCVFILHDTKAVNAWIVGSISCVLI